MLKKKCSTTDSEWEKHSRTRALKKEACSKALAFLTSDNAQGRFTRTFNPAFVQRIASMSSECCTEASVLLSIAARSWRVLGWLRWQLKSSWMLSFV